MKFMDAANNTGASVKKREDTHKMAEANKALLITVGRIVQIKTIQTGRRKTQWQESSP